MLIPTCSRIASVAGALLATVLAAAASGQCPGSGDCCLPNDTPGCSDAACCDAVCQFDPFCCATNWDDLCHLFANDLCPICSTCPGDITGDLEVDGADLALILGDWGPCFVPDCPSDLNGDGVVNGVDLGLILRSWGPCGACCLADQTCQVATVEECNVVGGIFEPGVTCSAATCLPIGACCLPDGSCLNITPAACEDRQGIFQGEGVDFADVVCPQPAGACCLLDGSCTETTAEGCADLNGVYQGDFSTCDNVTCPPPTGACCLPDGSCVEVSLAECFDAGGAYHGDLTTCADVDCNPFGLSCCANGKPRVLEMLYTAEDCSATSHSQDPDKVSCEDLGPLPAVATVLATNKADPADMDAKVWFSGTVALGTIFAIDATNAGETKLASETFIHIFNDAGELVQTVKFHTSCSQPLLLGNQFGASKLVGCVGEDEPDPNDCCANGKPRVLEMLYTAEDCSATSHSQDPDKVSCEDLGPLPAMATVLATNKADPAAMDAKVWFSGTAALGEVFAIDATNAGETKLASETFIHIFNDAGDLVQTVKFHTSCSQPLLLGNQFGASKLVGCVGENEPDPNDCCANGKPRVLEMLYTAEDCSATSHSQDPDKVSCEDLGPLPAVATVLATNKADPAAMDAKVWFSGTVALGEVFAIDATNAGETKLASETFIHIFNDAGDLVQTVKFHTSCSQPLLLGNQFGASKLVGCVGEDE